MCFQEDLELGHGSSRKTPKYHATKLQKAFGVLQKHSLTENGQSAFFRIAHVKIFSFFSYNRPETD